MRHFWLIGGAIAMGLGIWSMYFIAMLVYHLPIPINYDSSIVLVSMATTIVVFGAALFVVSRQIEDEGWHVHKDGLLFWTNTVLTASLSVSGQVKLKLAQRLPFRFH